MDPETQKHFRPLLEQRLSLVEARIHALKAQAVPVLTDGGQYGNLPASTQWKVPDADALLALQMEQLRLLNARGRLDAGAYDRCMYCGSNLPETLLHRAPDAVMCESCQSRNHAVHLKMLD